jgi:hypothetical protein
MVAAAVGAGIAVSGVAGAAISSGAAGKASDQQEQSAEDANALQKQIYDQNTQNFQPYLQAGNAGLNALLYRLGLGGSANGAPVAPQQTADQIRQQLLPQYTSTKTTTPDVPQFIYSQWGGGDAGTSYGYVPNPDYQAPQSEQVIDEAGLQKAINDQLAQQSQAVSQQGQAGQPGNADFGSLLNPYQAYKPFSADDFQVDPGYQFRLDQGDQQIKQAAASTGGLNSGRALKALNDYNQGSASQEYQQAYNRYNNDYTTGFNSYNTSQNNLFNKLAAVTGIGQSSASALAGVGNNYANQVGSNDLQAGNAAAAGTVGQANAANQAIGTGTNALSNYLLNQQSQSGYGAAPQNGAPSNLANGSMYGDASSRVEYQ